MTEKEKLDEQYILGVSAGVAEGRRQIMEIIKETYPVFYGLFERRLADTPLEESKDG